MDTSTSHRSSPSFVVLVCGLAMGIASLADAQTAARGRAVASAPTAQTSAAGIKVGDTVSISTAFGWAEGKVVSFSGDNYQVLVSTGAQVLKTYPAELRRIGPLTAYDRSRGIYGS